METFKEFNHFKANLEDGTMSYSEEDKENSVRSFYPAFNLH